MNEFTSRFVNVDGILTHYLEMGDPALRPIVLIHGGGAGADALGNWRSVGPLLADIFRIVAVEMVGFGQTGKPDPSAYEYSQANRNQHLAGFIETLGLGPALLVGNSMGGATALGVAMERPELVERLVLMGSAGLNAEITEALKPIVFYDFTEDGMRRMIAALTGPDFEPTDDLVRARHQLSVEPDCRAAYGQIMSWVSSQGGLYYAEDDIRTVKTPTLVVNGKDDLVVPLANAYKFLDLLPNSWGYVIPRCGHWAMIEAAPDFAMAVRNFMKDAA